ncbi:HEAT repeat domain-containing protein [Lysobacter gummosus]|uniref:DUF4303 domain-containing protein n=1 Tax=Lysobacter gummosus TaxID=262324 RepID=A0ABY3XEC0_9GAMM|nr:HEAT repeat domain-containing protein [Lysobacter gummosus]ALN94031.1 HEAT repeats family protein [Lysobacter gummosus]UNP29466.1 DUF4303 domain-containing protein [Lysobacter gummosus]
MIDWNAVEDCFVADATAALRALFARHPEQAFYVAALYGAYRELDGPIYLPSLAANSLQALGRDTPMSDPPCEFHSEAWNPPDWQWPDLDFAGPALCEWAARLDRHARDASREQWLDSERRWLQVLVAACRRIAEALAALPMRAPLLVVFVHDEEHVETLLRQCLDEPVFARLFPGQLAIERERARLDALAPSARAEALLELAQRHDSLLGWQEIDERLCAIGAAAVPALLARLRADARDWRAAMLLGRIGEATTEVVEALRRQAGERGEASARAWAARSLALLGDNDWLFAQLERGAGTPALEGLCAPYRHSRDGSRCRLDYAVLERLLAGPARTAAQALEILKPGSGYGSLRAQDIDEALRGLRSGFPFVRRHAAIVLSERGLGARAGERILPALAERIGRDEDPEVRWFSVLGLGDWKSDARPWHAAAEAALADPDPRVRDAARRCLDG